MLDYFVSSQLTWEFKNVIINEQHGFCQGKSTLTNLLIYQNDILDAFERKHQIHSIYSDFSKAFDTVNHKHLISKLGSLGIGGSLLAWIESFLTGRNQWVKINNFLSNTIEVYSGVPQGSHCGPLFFNLFINDIAEYITHSKFLLFADDLKIYLEISNLSDCLLLQEDLNSFVNWCELNCMKLNTDKCYCVNFNRLYSSVDFDYTLNNIPLKLVTDIKDLGILFDTKLSFTNHISTITNKARKMLGFIFRIGKHFSAQTLKILYCAYVRSHLEYAAVLWSPFYNIHIQSIESVQNRFVRCISHKLYAYSNNPFLLDNTEVCNILNIKSLSDRRTCADLLFVFKLLSGIVICPELLQNINFSVKSTNTRDKSLFHINYHSSNYGFHRPMTRMLRAANGANTELDLFNHSLQSFKCAVK